MSIDSYPLAWPDGWPRAKHRKDAHFSTNDRHYEQDRIRIDRKGLTMDAAIKRLRYELERLGVKPDDVVISTNIKLNLMGNPRGDTEPGDPGVAVYWSKKGQPGTKVIAVDAYRRVRDNIAAIAKTLEAMRAIERHGGATILDRAFSGFAAIAPPDWKRPWREVFGQPAEWWASPETLLATFRAKAKARHPDAGGSDTLMAELNVAYADAKAELGYG